MKTLDSELDPDQQLGKNAGAGAVSGSALNQCGSTTLVWKEGFGYWYYYCSLDSEREAMQILHTLRKRAPQQPHTLAVKIP